MEIKGNMNIGGLNGMTPTRHTHGSAKRVASDTSFTGSAALEGALGQVPDVRTDAVQRAKSLIADPGYPSADTVKKLSDFLAVKLTQPAE